MACIPGIDVYHLYFALSSSYSNQVQSTLYFSLLAVGKMLSVRITALSKILRYSSHEDAIKVTADGPRGKEGQTMVL